MFLKHKTRGDLLEVLDLTALFDPSVGRLSARFHVGEEMPEPDQFSKQELVFPSGEALPQCWQDADYRV